MKKTFALHATSGRRGRLATPVATAVILLCGAPAWPEDAPDPAPTRVRITAPGVAAERIVGDLVSIDAATIRLKLGGDRSLLVPRADIARIEVRTATSRRGRGALVGGLTGLVAGAFAGAASRQTCTQRPDDFLGLSQLGCEIGNDVAPAGGALVGAVLGSVVGALVAHGERWRPADFDRLHVGVTSSVRRGRFGAALTLSF